MKDYKVYVTREIPGNAIQMLKDNFKVEINPYDRPVTREELISKIDKVDAVLCMLTDPIDKEVIKRAENVKIFANYAVGYNNIDVDTATKQGIFVTNTPDVLTDTTADLTWALLFAASRRIVEADNFTREGKFKKWIPTLLLGQDITGKTLGIIGAGRIGKAFAKKSVGFNMKVLYYNRKRDLDFEKECNAKWVELDVLLKEADFISVHTPLTKETIHLISKREFEMMKKTAIFINTSRGPVVDEKALVTALKEHQIWAAGLDVFEKEPELEEGLIDLHNVVVVPHIGSATIETRCNMGEMAANNIISVLKGNGPINAVNNIK